MKEAVLVRPGPLCTVQDLGRTHGARLGVSPGGAMDRNALQWANRLLGNDPGAAGLEITLGNAELHFLHPGMIALTGAECEAHLDGSPVGSWRSFPVGPGQRLTLRFAREGMRAYLAVPGGIQAPVWFGSASTVEREGHAGTLGRRLEAGAVVAWPAADSSPGTRRVPPAYTRLPGSALDLPLVTGYEFEAFDEADRRAVFEAAWSLGTDSNRTAALLEGPPLASGPSVLDSSPLVDGTVQVLSSGRPLVFMRDRPTIGGYAKIGAVLPEALDRLAQARPGTRIRFVPADLEAARARWLEHRAFFAREDPGLAL